MSEIKSILSAQTSLKEKTSGSISSAESVAYLSTEPKEKYYVIDTNIIIDNPDIIPTKRGFKKLAIQNIDLKNSCIVVPDTVLHELKSFRHESSERSFIAGKVLSRIDELVQSVLADESSKLGRDPIFYIGNQIAFENCSRAFMIIKSTESAVVSWDFEPVNMDEQIFLQTLDLARCLKEGKQAKNEPEALNKKIRLVTNDKEMRICAVAHNIKSLPLETDPKFKFTGRRKCVIPPDLYNNFMQKGGFITLEEWEARMPNEPLLTPNEFIEFSCEDGSNYEDVNYSKGKFWNIGRLDVSGDEDKIVHLNSYLNSKQKPFLKAKTPGQAMYLDSIYNKNIDMILVSGCPGTGKTFIAAIEGMKQVQKGDYDIVSVVASEVRGDDGVGTLPGDLEEKMSIKSANIINALLIYHEIYDDDPCNNSTLIDQPHEEITHQSYIHDKNWIYEDDDEYTMIDKKETFTCRTSKKRKHEEKNKSKNKYSEKSSSPQPRVKQQRLEDKANLSYQKSFRSIPIFYIKGKSFQNDFIIVDEAQDMTNEQMLSAMTRIGEGSKMIFTGDESQPHPYAKGVNKHHNGILYARRALKGIPRAAQIFMDENDIVRSSIIGQILDNLKPLGLDRENDNDYVED
jgi:phoH family protein